MDGKAVKPTLDCILQKLDEQLGGGSAEAGLKVPVILYGYTMLNRGISCRSNLRVPTHLMMALGAAMSQEKCVQGGGRLLGEFKSLLRKNFGL